MRYRGFKRGKRGPCNICLADAELTWDHVPPKGCQEFRSIEIHSSLKCIATDESLSRQEYSQNGLKYRTLCAKCNNQLGREDDPYLIDFSRTVTRYLSTELWVPEVVSIRTRPIRLLRSVLGHLLAARTSLGTVPESRIRKFILKLGSRLDESINIFYWIHPYKCIKIQNDCGIIALRQKGDSRTGIFSVLKFFPLAFLITSLEQYEGLPNITSFRNLQLDDEAAVSVDLVRVHHYAWPEHPQDSNNIVLLSQESRQGITAVPRTRILKSKKTP